MVHILKKRPFRYILNQAFKSFVKFLTQELNSLFQ